MNFVADDMRRRRSSTASIGAVFLTMFDQTSKSRHHPHQHYKLSAPPLSVYGGVSASGSTMGGLYATDSYAARPVLVKGA